MRNNYCTIKHLQVEMKGEWMKTMDKDRAVLAFGSRANPVQVAGTWAVRKTIDTYTFKAHPIIVSIYPYHSSATDQL
jgi:hypothetical protein